MEENETTIENDYEPRVRVRDRSGNRGSRHKGFEWTRKHTAITAGAVAVLIVLAIAADAVSSAGKVHPGVRVGGVDVGGMTQEQARRVLASGLAKQYSEPVEVLWQENSWHFIPSDVGMAFVPADEAEAAMAVGRSGDALKSATQRLSCWLGGVDLEPTPIFDEKRVDTTIAKVAKVTDQRPVDATVEIDGTDVTVKPAQEGRMLDRESLEAALKAAYVAEDRTVSASAPISAPRISDAVAQAAIPQVEQMLDGPVTVTHDGKSWKFSAEEIGKWIVFKAISSAEASASADSSETSSPASAAQSDGEWVLVPELSADEASSTVYGRIGVVGNPPKDAEFKTAGGQVTIQPSIDGDGPDVKTLVRDLNTTLKDGDDVRSAKLVIARVPADFTTEEAKAMGIKERISTYTTTFSPSNRPRVNNIHTLAQAIDGTLVPPGGVFSFNGTVGERTADKGYQEANAIVGGKLVPQLGGGICQVGTTLFNAIFESGLPVVERHNHSFYISHYPKGRDATVSWGGPDLKFKNDTEDWILVAAGWSAGTVTMSIYGTDPDYEVEGSTGAWTNIKPYRTETVKDPNVAKGTKIVEDPGEQGRRCVVTRTVRKGGQVIREDTFTSVYGPKVEVVRVGTKELPAGTGTTVTPTP